MLTLTVKGEQELRALARDLKRAPAHLRKELHAAFRDAGNVTLRRVKANITTMPIRGYRVPGAGNRRFTADMRGGNIRRRISAVTQMSVRTAGANPRVAFVVHADRLGDARNVPWHLDTGKIFRHPIMGKNADGSWRGGAGSSGKPWFYDEIRSGLGVFEAECDKAITATIRALEG